VTERVAVEVTVAAPAAGVWRALRDPAELRRWFGWEYDGLEAEIEAIFLPAAASEVDGTLDTGAGRFELEPRGESTIVRVVMPGTGDDAIEQGWITFAQQLRFALERHPGQDRETVYLSGDPGGPLGLDGLADLAAGERYAASAVTGEQLTGSVWLGSEHQLGLTVDAWGDGLAGQSFHQPGSISVSLFWVFGAPKASSSAPSGPASKARQAMPGTRSASQRRSSTTSSSTFMRMLPLTTT
jgi:uncharacterized protein YndB with AHSA1/START domain